MRYLALAAYLHPAMSKNVQKWMMECASTSLWEIDDQMDIQLEVLTITALTPHLDHRILSIPHPPNTVSNSY
jgi:hypothetical protein